MEFNFANPKYLHLLWVTLALVAAYLFGFARRRRALARFASGNLIGHLVPGLSIARRRVRAGMVVVVFVLMVFALAGPRWGEKPIEIYQRGVDVMVLLDVSRSMLADDARPTRLEKAKQYVRDLLEQLPGDRIGLVTFAGQPTMACPLTPNYGWFRIALDEAGTGMAAQGGSNIAEAMRLAARKLGEREGNHKAMLLITDGEDQDSDPQYAAAFALEDFDVRTFTIGLGDGEEGSRIPIVDDGKTEYIREEDGTAHVSRMNASLLAAIAAGGDGFSVPAGTADIDMADFYKKMIARLDPQDYQAQRRDRQIERYQWFAAGALLLLLIESLMTERRRGATMRDFVRARAGMLASCIGVALLMPATAARADDAANENANAASHNGDPGQSSPVGDPYERVQAGNQAFAEGRYDEALNAYDAFANQVGQSQRIKYNRGAARYKLGQFDEAGSLFAEASLADDPVLSKRSKFAWGNCDYGQALETLQQASAAARQAAANQAAGTPDAAQAGQLDGEALIEQFESAIRHYRDALETGDNVDPSTDNLARQNIERAQIMIDEIREMQQEQQQDQQQQDQQQQNQQGDQEGEQQEQDQQSQEGDQQQGDQQQQQDGQQDQQQAEQGDQSQQSQDGDDQEQSEQDAEQQPQPGEWSENAPEDQQQQQSQSQQGDQEQEQQSDRQQQQPGEQPDDQRQDQPSQQQGQEQQDQDQQQQARQDQQQNQDQSQPDGQSTSASPEQLGDQSGEPQEGEPQTIEGQITESDGPMTDQEIEAVLQSVRDREKQRRAERMARIRAQQKPVKKDW